MKTSKLVRSGIKAIALSLLLFFCSTNLQSQKNPKRFAIADTTKSSVVVKFKMVNNYVVFPVVLNQFDTLQLIFDSGLEGIVLFQESLGNSHISKKQREVKYSNPDNSVSKLVYSYNNVLQIDGITGQMQDIIVKEGLGPALSSKLGTKVDGMIGYNLLKDFVVELDYQHKSIAFFAPRKYEYKKKVQMLPLIIDNMKPYVQTDIVDACGEKLPVKLLLNTSAGYSLWLDVNSDPHIKVPGKSIYSYIGASTGGDIQGYIGRISNVSLGKYRLSNVISYFPDKASFPKCNGILGGDILRRFTLIIDYRKSQIGFKANGFYNQPFTYNVSGVEVTLIGDTMFQVSNVREFSNAQKAGVKAGDILISINNRSVKNMSIDEVYSQLQPIDGQQISVNIKRDGQQVSIDFFIEPEI
jgi:hypothetical protein